MCFCSSKQNSNPLAKQYKLSKKKFTKNEFLLLNKIFNDISSRSAGDTMAKEDFIRFFPLSGLWGDRMFERFDLMSTGAINQEEFIIGLGNSAKLSQEEQIKYLFNVYDLTNNNCITKGELLMMLYNYPQEDLQEITQDPYFTEIMKKKEHQKKQAEEPSFNATSQFFQSQIKGFMQSRQSNTNFNSQLDVSQHSGIQQNQQNQQSRSTLQNIKNEDEIGQEDPVLCNIMIQERHISKQATKQFEKSDNLQQFIKKTVNTKPTGHVHMSKNNSNINANNNNKTTLKKENSNTITKINNSNNQPTKPKKTNNIPIKPSNITNVIKQYCDFVFREFDIETLSYDHFKTWCLEHYTVFNIFKNTFYFGFWGEEDGEMQYKHKQLDMEGFLYKIKQDKTIKKRYYELRENFLIYFSEKGAKPKGIICLEGLIVKVNDANEFKNDEILKKKMQGYAGFEITHKDQFYKPKKLYCPLDERHQWMKNLEDYSKTNFHDQYVLHEKIGVGRFSVVYRGSKKNSDQKQEFAVKIMKKNELTNEEIQFISYETETMRFLKHPGIINVDKTIEDKNNIYIITEIVKGGDLFQYIHQNEFLEEVEASILMKQLFATILYIHDAGIIHRDLKPENIMVVKSTEKDKNGQFPVKQIKIIDFGFSKMLQIGQLCEGYCGSQNYLAPEIIKNEMYGMKVDNFALGCIMFFMLRGSLPFDSWDPEEINQNTLEGKYSLDDEHWNNVSSQAKDLIEKLLKINPDERISTKDALQHEWITNRKLLQDYKGKNQHGIWDQKEDPSIINQSNY